MKGTQHVYRAYLRKVHLLGGEHERVRYQQTALFRHFNGMRPESCPAIASFMLPTSLLQANKASEETMKFACTDTYSMPCDAFRESSCAPDDTSGEFHYIERSQESYML